MISGVSTAARSFPIRVENQGTPEFRLPGAFSPSRSSMFLFIFYVPFYRMPANPFWTWNHWKMIKILGSGNFNGGLFIMLWNST